MSEVLHPGSNTKNFQKKPPLLPFPQVFRTDDAGNTLLEYEPANGSVRARCMDKTSNDYHVVDFKRNIPKGKSGATETRYFTAFVDPYDVGNVIEVYDTTDLSQWEVRRIRVVISCIIRPIGLSGR
jgi:hypothetical protein